MSVNVAIGVQDFSTLIENHYFYVDKTAFLKEWWDSGDSVTLITRPRRLRKTAPSCSWSTSFQNVLVS